MGDEREEVVPHGEPDRTQAVATIGRFEILERLGSGGMGIVYAARDPDLEQRVAVRVLRGIDERGRARVLREAQATARLRHPNVVRVYETGSHDDDVYVAMEYIEGQPLGQWQEGRDLDQILAAYRAAGRGLAAAHRVGLTHRDFKPDNVRVDGEGHVRVLDFGLARGSGSDATTDDGPATRGDPSRRDQFSFCAALWEAVYGTRPGDDVEPDSPPVGKAPRRFERALRRGLEHDPSERFASMNDLLAALPRDHLESRRHHWRLAGASTLLVLSLGALNGIRNGQLDDDRRCPDASRYLEDVWDDDSRAALQAHFYEHEQPYTDVAWRRTSTALDAHADAWVIAYSTTCDALVSSDNRDPVLLEQGACLRWRLEQLSTTVDVLTDADPVLLSEAASIISQLGLVDDCEDPATAQRLLRLPGDRDEAGAVQDLRMRIANANGSIRARQEAQATEALESVVEEARELGHQPVLAEALLALGNASRERDRKLAEASFREAIEIAGSSGHDIVGGDAWLALVEHLHADHQRIDEAASLLPAAQFALSRVEDPRRRARLESVCAGIELRRANYDLAHEHYAKGIGILEEAGDHDLPLYADLLSRVAGVELERLNFERALKLAERALEVAEYVHGPGHPATLGPLANAAGAHVKLGQLDEARAYYEEMLAAWRTVHGEDKTTAFVIDVLGVIDERQDNLEDALRRATKALEIRERVLASHHVELGTSHRNVANVLRRQGKLEEAREHFEAANEVFATAHGTDQRQTLEVHISLALVDEAAGRYQTALEGFEGVLEALGETENAPATRARAEYGKARMLVALERDVAEAARIAAAAETHAREGGDEELGTDVAAWRAAL